MKKLLATLLTLTLLLGAIFTLGSCAPQTTKLRVGYMTGPTGMGMAKLISDNGGAEVGNNKYEFNKYTDTAAALADLTKGAVDIVCLPTNEAANNYNKTYENLTVLNINTLGSVYLITDEANSVSSFAELENKTIYTCLKGTPKIILTTLLEAAGVNATVLTEFDGATINSPADLQATLVNKDGIGIAVAPEPIVSAVTSAKSAYSVKLNLGEVWNEHFDTPLAMGCAVSTKEFVAENKKAVNDFLNEYEASIEYVNDRSNVETSAQLIVDAGIIPKLQLTKKALGNLIGSIAYIDGEDMKEALVGFYEAIGLTLPNNEFYYEK